jgi:myo-inositol-1(or 4)-monophosphatase
MLDLDWTEAMRRVVDGQRQLFQAEPTIAGRTVYEGIGEGGDHSLALDRRCEDLVFAELERLQAESGAAFVAVSEERGEVAFGEGESPWRVVIDPIDGSLNVRRTIPSHCLSVAVASGPAMADVEWGYVYEFGTGEEFTARRGAGARLDGRELTAQGPPISRLNNAGAPLRPSDSASRGLEVVGLESADPERIAPVVDALRGKAYRIRVIGSIAITLCWVAAGRLDAMLSARPCRSVDAAAAQLIVSEAGGRVEFAGLALEEAGLDLDARYPVLAGLDEELLATVREAQATAPRP